MPGRTSRSPVRLPQSEATGSVGTAEGPPRTSEFSQDFRVRSIRSLSDDPSAFQSRRLGFAMRRALPGFRDPSHAQPASSWSAVTWPSDETVQLLLAVSAARSAAFRSRIGFSARPVAGR